MLVGTALDRDYAQLEPWLAQIQALGLAQQSVALLPYVVVRAGDTVAAAAVARAQRRWGLTQLTVAAYRARTDAPDDQPGVRAALAREAAAQEVDALFLLDAAVRIPAELWLRLLYCYGHAPVVVGGYEQWVNGAPAVPICVELNGELSRADARRVVWTGSEDECPAVYVQGAALGCVLVRPAVAAAHPFESRTLPVSNGAPVEGEHIGWFYALGNADPPVPALMPLEVYGGVAPIPRP